MAFPDFHTISAVQKQYSIVYREEPFILPVPLAPSQAFLDDHRFRITYLDVLASEASRCENIIYPVLFEVYKHHADTLSLWSHTAIAYDDVLAGVPDYIVSARSRLGKTFLETPLLIVAEAKRSDFGQGWGQCLAALVAAQRLNRDESFRCMEL